MNDLGENPILQHTICRVIVCPTTPVLGPLNVLPTLPGTEGSWEMAVFVPFA